jgi:large subunit ribosomal protein L28
MFDIYNRSTYYKYRTCTTVYCTGTTESLKQTAHRTHRSLYFRRRRHTRRPPQTLLPVLLSIMFSSTIRSVSRLTALNHSSALPAFATSSPFLETIRHRSNRSRRGLYDGKDIRSGNNVSFSKRRTKRTFKPNVFLKRVYSEVLDEMVKFHLTTSTLRTIDKYGGLDIYLMTSKHVTEGEGLAVRNRILAKLEESAAIEEEAVPGESKTSAEIA